MRLSVQPTIVKQERSHKMERKGFVFLYGICQMVYTRKLGCVVWCYLQEAFNKLAPDVYVVLGEQG